MSKQTAVNLFMLPPLERYAGFYQQLLKGIGNYEQLGNRLIKLAEQAHALRHFHEVKEIALVLSNIPIKRFQTIAHYFLAIAANSKGNGDQGEAKRLFELAVDTAPDDYKVKATLSLGALSFHKRDFDSALYFYKETIKAGKLSAASIQAIKTINVVKALEGSHTQAVKGLETILPLIKYAPAHVYFDVLNSYAVELGAVGRKEEARNISRVVIESPFSFAYPEWKQTAQDLREPNRAFISVPKIERQQVEVTQPISKETEPKKPAKIISFPKLKEAPEPEMPEQLSTREYTEMTLSDKKEMILAAVKSGAIGEDDYYKLMIMLGLVRIGPADNILDLEDEETLDDIAVIWATHVGPESFAGVLSALRDCDDRLRQSEIIDRMIKKAFQQSDVSRMTEEDWRLKFERRLPKQ